MVRVYRHRSLQDNQSIRVLQLLPSLFAGPLRCRLSEVSMIDPPRYEALSYAWGSPEAKEEIICGNRTIYVTENCAHALRRLRRRHVPRTLWIDSICIDQKSPRERNHQVGMMGDVYRNATRVIVWLGSGSELTDKAFEYLSSVVRHRKLGVLTNGKLLERKISKFQGD